MERFRTITPTYYRGAQGVILVYDVANRESFDALPKWLADVEEYAPSGLVKIIVGNKVDMVRSALHPSSYFSLSVCSDELAVPVHYDISMSPHACPPRVPPPLLLLLPAP